MKKIYVEFSDERLITPSGLVFVGQILGKSSFVKKINRAPISNEYLQKQIKNGDILLTKQVKKMFLYIIIDHVYNSVNGFILF